MVIQSAVAKSIVIREIRSYTGTQGGLSPAIHRNEPHPVRPRYQYHKTCGSHCAIVQLDDRHSPAKHSVVSCFKSIYTLRAESHCFFNLCQPSCTLLDLLYFFFFFARANLDARVGSRGSRFAPVFSKHRSRSARTGTSAEIPGCTVFPYARLRIWSRETVPAVPFWYRT